MPTKLQNDQYGQSIISYIQILIEGVVRIFLTEKSSKRSKKFL